MGVAQIRKLHKFGVLGYKGRVIHIIESFIHPLQTPSDLLFRTVCSPTGVVR